MTVVAKADLRFADLDLAAGFEMYWGFDDDAVIAGTIGRSQIMKPERIALLPHFSVRREAKASGMQTSLRAERPMVVLKRAKGTLSDEPLAWLMMRYAIYRL